LGIVRPTEKHCELLLRCTHQKITNGISATAAADCIAPDWPVRVALTFHPLTNRHFLRCGLLSKFFGRLFPAKFHPRIRDIALVDDF